MPRFPFFERVNVAEHVKQLTLSSYTPEIRLEGLVTGVDNLRSDVFLSPKLAEVTRAHLVRLIAKYGAVEDLVKTDPLSTAQQQAQPTWMRSSGAAKPKADSGADFKRAL